MSQCHHAGFTDAEISYCKRDGNMYCPNCGDREAKLCNDCVDELAERDSRREEKSLASWRDDKKIRGTA
jgi:hypothetical protein